MRFKTFVNETQDLELHLQAMLFLFENEDMLHESTLNEEVLQEAFDKHLKKVGLKLHKGKGILDYIKSFAVGIGKVFLYIIKGDVKKAQSLIKEIKREDILDFLYKLDLGTLHLVTGPIHMIDAWTGWDLAVSMSSHIQKGEGFSTVLKKAIEKVKTSIQHMFTGKQQKNLLQHVDSIEAVAL